MLAADRVAASSSRFSRMSPWKNEIVDLGSRPRLATVTKIVRYSPGARATS